MRAIGRRVLSIPIKKTPSNGPIIQQRYFIYQLCNFVLGVKYGSDAAKRYEWKNNYIRVYDKNDNIALEGSFTELLDRLRQAKGYE